MYKQTLMLLALLASGQPGRADVLLTLVPITASGSPGDTVGWGFNLSADPDFYVSVASAFIDTETNPALGSFTDFISLAGGPLNGVLSPGAADWTQSYSGLPGTGFGEYIISPAATPGDTNLGSMLMVYLRYSGDPNTCGSCFIDSMFTSASFGVNVVATTVPEPSWSIVPGLAVLASASFLRRRTRRRAS